MDSSCSSLPTPGPPATSTGNSGTAVTENIAATSPEQASSLEEEEKALETRRDAAAPGLSSSTSVQRTDATTTMTSFTSKQRGIPPLCALTHALCLQPITSSRSLSGRLAAAATAAAVAETMPREHEAPFSKTRQVTESRGDSGTVNATDAASSKKGVPQNRVLNSASLSFIDGGNTMGTTTATAPSVGRRTNEPDARIVPSVAPLVLTGAQMPRVPKSTSSLSEMPIGQERVERQDSGLHTVVVPVSCLKEDNDAGGLLPPMTSVAESPLSADRIPSLMLDPPQAVDDALLPPQRCTPPSIFATTAPDFPLEKDWSSGSWSPRQMRSGRLDEVAHHCTWDSPPRGGDSAAVEGKASRAVSASGVAGGASGQPLRAVRSCSVRSPTPYDGAAAAPLPVPASSGMATSPVEGHMSHTAIGRYVPFPSLSPAHSCKGPSGHLFGLFRSGLLLSLGDEDEREEQSTAIDAPMTPQNFSQLMQSRGDRDNMSYESTHPSLVSSHVFEPPIGEFATSQSGAAALNVRVPQALAMSNSSGVWNRRSHGRLNSSASSVTGLGGGSGADGAGAGSVTNTDLTNDRLQGNAGVEAEDLPSAYAAGVASAADRGEALPWDRANLSLGGSHNIGTTVNTVKNTSLAGALCSSRGVSGVCGPITPFGSFHLSSQVELCASTVDPAHIPPTPTDLRLLGHSSHVYKARSADGGSDDEENNDSDGEGEGEGDGDDDVSETTTADYDNDGVIETSTLERARALSADGLSAYEVLNEQYILYDYELGKGTSSKVQLCYDLKDGRYYAAKMLDQVRMKRRQLGSDLSLFKIDQEITIMKQLQHRNIIRLREVIRDPTARYVVLILELAEGRAALTMKDNGDVVPRAGGRTDYPEATVCRIVRGLLHALMYTHYLGIAHRDVKPSNVLLAAHGVVKLCDFGASLIVGENAMQLRREGSVAFLAPELLVSNALDVSRFVSPTQAPLREPLPPEDPTVLASVGSSKQNATANTSTTTTTTNATVMSVSPHNTNRGAERKIAEGLETEAVTEWQEPRGGSREPRLLLVSNPASSVVTPTSASRGSVGLSGNNTTANTPAFANAPFASASATAFVPLAEAGAAAATPAVIPRDPFVSRSSQQPGSQSSQANTGNTMTAAAAATSAGLIPQYTDWLVSTAPQNTVDLFKGDVFSLGVTVFTLLLGRLPWRASSASSQLSAVLQEPDPFLKLYKEAYGEDGYAWPQRVREAYAPILAFAGHPSDTANAAAAAAGSSAAHSTTSGQLKSQGVAPRERSGRRSATHLSPPLPRTANTDVRRADDAAHDAASAAVGAARRRSPATLPLYHRGSAESGVASSSTPEFSQTKAVHEVATAHLEPKSTSSPHSNELQSSKAGNTTDTDACTTSTYFGASARARGALGSHLSGITGSRDTTQTLSGSATGAALIMLMHGGGSTVNSGGGSNRWGQLALDALSSRTLTSPTQEVSGKSTTSSPPRRVMEVLAGSEREMRGKAEWDAAPSEKSVRGAGAVVTRAVTGDEEAASPQPLVSHHRPPTAPSDGDISGDEEKEEAASKNSPNLIEKTYSSDSASKSISAQESHHTAAVTARASPTTDEDTASEEEQPEDEEEEIVGHQHEEKGTDWSGKEDDDVSLDATSNADAYDDDIYEQLYAEVHPCRPYKMSETCSLSALPGLNGAGSTRAISAAAVDFVRACLAINPTERRTVFELFHHPWVANAFSEVNAPDAADISWVPPPRTPTSVSHSDSDGNRRGSSSSTGRQCLSHRWEDVSGEEQQQQRQQFTQALDAFQEQISATDRQHTSREQRLEVEVHRFIERKDASPSTSHPDLCEPWTRDANTSPEQGGFNAAFIEAGYHTSHVSPEEQAVPTPVMGSHTLREHDSRDGLAVIRTALAELHDDEGAAGGGGRQGRRVRPNFSDSATSDTVLRSLDSDNQKNTTTASTLTLAAASCTTTSMATESFSASHNNTHSHVDVLAGAGASSSSLQRHASPRVVSCGASALCRPPTPSPVGAASPIRACPETEESLTGLPGVSVATGAGIASSGFCVATASSLHSLQRCRHQHHSPLLESTRSHVSEVKSEVMTQTLQQSDPPQQPPPLSFFNSCSSRPQPMSSPSVEASNCSTSRSSDTNNTVPSLMGTRRPPHTRSLNTHSAGDAPLQRSSAIAEGNGNKSTAAEQSLMRFTVPLPSRWTSALESSGGSGSRATGSAAMVPLSPQRSKSDGKAALRSAVASTSATRDASVLLASRRQDEDRTDRSSSQLLEGSRIENHEENLKRLRGLPLRKDVSKKKSGLAMTASTLSEVIPPTLAVDNMNTGSWEASSAPASTLICDEESHVPRNSRSASLPMLRTQRECAVSTPLRRFLERVTETQCEEEHRSDKDE